MSLLGPSLAGTIRNSKSLSKFFKPIAGWYANLAGYRQHGLKYDDLIVEESDIAQKVRLSFLPLPTSPLFLARDADAGLLGVQALSRLTEREQYDRAYRIRVASQLSVLHKELPKADWTKPEDVRLPLSSVQPSDRS